MKKFLAVFSLLMLVLLTGCLSDKTERDLNATPTTAGETNYKYLTVKPDDSKLVKVTGKYYSLKNLNTLISEQKAFEQATGKETFKLKSEYPKVDLVVSINDLKIEEQKSGIIGEYVVDSIKSETKFGDGQILFPVQGINGDYKAYEVVTNKDEKLYVYFALLRKKIKLLDSTEKELSYLVTNIAKTKGDCLNFETLLKTLNMEEQNIASEITGDEKAQKEKELYTNLNVALQKEEIRAALDKLYEHIEKYYSNEAGITIGMTQEEKLIKTWEYANELKPNVEFNTYQLVRNKVTTLSSYILKDLEGGLASLRTKLSMVDPDPTEISYSVIKTETENVEKYMEEYQTVIQEQRYLEKKDGRLFTTQYVLYGASEDYASKPLYKTGIQYLTVAKMIELADLNEYGNKQGEEREYQISKILKWYNIVNREYYPVLDTMYKSDDKEGIAIDYVNKKSTNGLYAGIPNDYVEFYDKLVESGKKTGAEVSAMKSSLITTITNKFVESGEVIISQVGNYYTTNVGIYYKTKAIGEVTSQSSVNSLIKEINNSFEIYMEKIKFYNEDVINELDLINKRDWQYIKNEIESSNSIDIKVQLFKEHTMLYDQIINEYNNLP